MKITKYLGDDDKCGGCGCDPCIGSKCPWKTNGFRQRMIGIASIGVALGITLAGCTSDADTASRNLSTEADQFKVVRKITVVNTWTGETLWNVEGRCSLDLGNPAALALTCKEAANEYKKHYISLGGNVNWTSTQMASIDVDVYRTKVIFKPTSVVPDVDLSVGNQ